MKPLSKCATKALEVLKAGGFFVSDPEYGGTYVSLSAADRSPVDGFDHRGFAKEAMHELMAAGYASDEEMDGRNFIIWRLLNALEPTS